MHLLAVLCTWEYGSVAEWAEKLSQQIDNLFRSQPNHILILSSHPLLGQMCHLPVHPCPGLIHLVDLLFGKNNFDYPSCADKGPEEVDSLEHVQYIRKVPE